MLFLSDILPTGYMGAEMCDIQPGDVVAVWGAGPVGQFAMDSARVLGAAEVIAIDEVPYRLEMAAPQGYDDDQLRRGDVARRAQGADRRPRPGQVHRRGRHGGHPRRRPHPRLRPGQAGRPSETDRPHALREAILACRSGGIVSVIGVYGGFIDKFPAGAWMNRALTLRAGQCHVQRYMRPLLERIERGEIDPPA